VRFLLPIGLLLVLPMSLSLAATINVPADQSTVRAAVDAAASGDTILIAPGVHAGGVAVAGKSVTLASWFLATGDTSYIAQTVINGTMGQPCEGDTICPGSAVLDFAPSTSGSAVTGLTITNGADGIGSRAIVDISYCRIIGNGDGVDFQGGSGGTFRNSLFANNTDDGIDLNGRINASILDNVIRDNHQDGVEFRLFAYNGPRTNVDLIGNRITGNGSDGIQLIDYPEVTDRVIRIERNVFSGNADASVGCLSDGRTIEDFSGAPIAERVFLIHNTFAGERYGMVGGANVVALNNIFVGTQASALRRVGGNSIASYSLFWNNGTDHEDSNIDLPHTVYANPWLDAAYAPTAGSPAVDAGTAFYQWQGEAVLDVPPASYVGSAPDMGFIEFTGGPPAEEPNLVENPSFEANTNGWIGLASTTLARVAGGCDGDFSAQLTGTAATASSFGLNDSPDWVRNVTSVGIRYRFIAWVSSASSGGTARIQIKEYLMSNGALQGEITSAGVQLSPEWQMLTVDYITRSAGTTLDVYIKDFPLVAGETFLVDKVSVRYVGTLTAVEVQTPPVEQSSVRRVYPTPTRGLLHVEARGPVTGSASLRIVQANGRVVRERRYSGLAPGQYQTLSLDTSGLPSGVYFLWYEGSNERTMRAGRKIILLR
jgi:Right handed beta helix region/Secretion system C-terminal sorting domain